MEHNEAVQTLAVEKYLLDEFDSGEREAFEDHFFSCHACAEELQATAALLDRGKELFAREPMSYVERAPQPAAAETTPERANLGPGRRDRLGWLGWLRPAIAAPAMALLLLVVGVQNLYQVPGLERSLAALNAPAVLPSADLGDGTVRGAARVVVAKPGENFSLTIDLPENITSSSVVELYDVAGRKDWSLPIPENAPKIGLLLKMPGDLPAGSYSLVVQGSGGGSGGAGNIYPFTLQRQ
jgi:hypothetical protein